MALRAHTRGLWLIQAVLVAAARTCTAQASDRPPDSVVVYPIRVDSRGHFLSPVLCPRGQRTPRSVAALVDVQEKLFYRLNHRGLSLTFALSLNSLLLSPGAVSERRRGGVGGVTLATPTSAHCHFHGEVRGRGVRGQAAVSVCNGLTGMFKLSGEEFFIEPLQLLPNTSTQPHAVYKRHTDHDHISDSAHFPGHASSAAGTKRTSRNHTCGSTESAERAERHRQRWEQRHRRSRRLKQRSVSRERWVETLVVADHKMVEFHGREEVENYVLTVMNIVSGVFSDPSIGNSINIVVVRIILLEQDEEDLKISHHADHSLNSFCRWQKSLNPKGEEHPQHHDVAVLLTRKDICASVNSPCETLGLSHVSGLCLPHRSCSISEDTGLPLAFTVAHELGHNFGMQHDGVGNECESVGKRPFVMSPQLLYDSAFPRWSQCSREYLTRFLDRGWGWCLDDAPSQDRLNAVWAWPLLPGLLYSAPHQCRLQYGPGSGLCPDMDDVCQTLWCSVGQSCQSKLDRAVDGTTCGPEKWCLGGKCVSVKQSPVQVDGSWSLWSSWSPCSRSCGSGVQSAERDCTEPSPAHRGRYCLGERRRYRVCSSAPCASNKPSFRDLQCRQFNHVTYRGQQHEWEAVINRVNPCELHCRPLQQNFSEKMRDAVSDGTPCYEGTKRRDLCINGICKAVGCDLVIDSAAVEDRCGVCNGNGSTCSTVTKFFNQTEGLGYVDVGLIPEGSWQIRIEEVSESGNFLALRGDGSSGHAPPPYFLNGGWTIQWGGEYPAGGTLFKYTRTGQLEQLTSAGPTREPVWVQLLFQETNPGIRYEFTVNLNHSEERGPRATELYWKHGSWSQCSATCGTGVQTVVVHCVQRNRGIVEEQLCDPETKPETKTTVCERESCPPRWWAGHWQACSSSCGRGLSLRLVICVRSLGLDEEKKLPDSDCDHMTRPENTTSCNAHTLCPSAWEHSHWSECSVSCGLGSRWRNVSCSRNTGADCDPERKPPTVSVCHEPNCPKPNDNFHHIFDWSGSGWFGNEIQPEIYPRPESKPPPKVSTTKSQPRANQDSNNIVEGDFHYHNELENSGKHVHVDDFYYDYNFIDFHEDLSNDFEDDGKFSGNEDVPTSASSTLRPTTLTPSSASRGDYSAATKSPVQVKEMSRVLEDFLAEDLLLPVSPSLSPPQSGTKPAQTWNNDPTNGSSDQDESEGRGMFEHEDTGPEQDRQNTVTTPTAYHEGFTNTLQGILSYGESVTQGTTAERTAYSPHTTAEMLLPSTTLMENLSPVNSIKNDDQKESDQDKSETGGVFDYEQGRQTTTPTADYDGFTKTLQGLLYHYESQTPDAARESTSDLPYTTVETILLENSDSVNDRTNSYDIQRQGSSDQNKSEDADVFDYKDVGAEKDEKNTETRATTTPHADYNEFTQTFHGIFNHCETQTQSTAGESTSASPHTTVETVLTTTVSLEKLSSGNPTINDIHKESDLDESEDDVFDYTDTGAEQDLQITTPTSDYEEFTKTFQGILNQYEPQTQRTDTTAETVSTNTILSDKSDSIKATTNPYDEFSDHDKSEGGYVFDYKDIGAEKDEQNTETRVRRPPTVDYDEFTKTFQGILNQYESRTQSTVGESTSASPRTTVETVLIKTISLEKLSSVNPTINDNHKESDHDRKSEGGDEFDYTDTGAEQDLQSTTPAADYDEFTKTLQGILNHFASQTPDIAGEEIPDLISLEDYASVTNSYRRISEVFFTASTSSHVETGTRQTQTSEGPLNTDRHLSFTNGSPGTDSEDFSEGFSVLTTAGPVFSGVSLPLWESTTASITKEPGQGEQTATASESEVPKADAHWVSGDWSACSTSCGLGAVWRSLSCSSGFDSDCDPARRPPPAQRCYLRPCSVWRTGPWSKCSRNCGGGQMFREVQCLDLRDHRSLRPFHCRTSSSPPPSSSSCGEESCLDWEASSWGQCSEVCGGGQQQRIVSCPEVDRCDRALTPQQIQSCNEQSCAQWLSGSWSMCSSRCGLGLQFRLIKCFDTKEEKEAEPAQCSHEAPPPSTRKCQRQDCSPSGQLCLRDRVSSRFCQTLRWLGRCSLSNVRSQCCRTCGPRTEATPTTTAPSTIEATPTASPKTLSTDERTM